MGHTFITLAIPAAPIADQYSDAQNPTEITTGPDPN